MDRAPRRGRDPSTDDQVIFTEEVKLKDGVSSPAQQAAQKVRTLEAALTSTKRAMTLASAQHGEASRQYQALSTKATKLTNALEEQKAAASDSSMALTAGLGELTGGLTIAAGASLAAASAVIGVVYAGAQLAIQASEAAAQLRSMFNALGAGQITGEEVVGMLDDMSRKIGVAKDKLAPLAKEFLSMGVYSKEALKNMTLAAASAEALGGSSDAFVSMQRKIQAAAESGGKLKVKLAELSKMGLTVTDVASQMGISAEALAKKLKSGQINAEQFGKAITDALIKKGAKPLAEQSLKLSNLWDMAKQFGTELFEGLDDSIQPFLVQVKALFGIFDSKTNPSGQALKSAIGGFFKEVFALATKAVPLIRSFFLSMIIYALKAYIAAKPVVRWFKELQSNATVMSIVRSAVKGLVDVLIVLGVIVAAVVGISVAMFVAMSAALGVMTGLVWAAIGAVHSFLASVIGFVGKAGSALLGWLGSAATMAGSFIDGLVAGISAGIARVVAAVKNLAMSAKDAFTSALGIHSPSRVMMQLGNYVGAGAAEGIEASAPDVYASSGELARAAHGGMAKSAGGGGRGGGNTFHVNVQIDGAGKSAMEITEQMVSLVFERIALSQGLGAAP